MNIFYATCIICVNNQLQFKFKAKDHTVSGEEFEIFECNNCSLRFTQNVEDENGIGKYYKSEEYISHSDTSKGFINFLYHFVRQITLKSKLSIINKFSGRTSGQILDIGAGTGAFLNVMKRAGWNIAGLEPDETARKNALKNYQLNLSGNEQLFAFQTQSFDAITMWHVLEHVHKLNEYISQAKNLLNENGVLVIAVPNYTSYDAEVYQQYWAAYDVPRHLYHFSPQSMKELLKKHDLKLIETLPMWFDSYYVSMLSEKYKHNGGNNFINALLTGFSSNLKAFFKKELCSSVIYVIKKKQALI
ncbi:MAG: methyltransferase domain-containing protein [Ginsengibacter sp.]